MRQQLEIVNIPYAPATLFLLVNSQFVHSNSDTKLNGTNSKSTRVLIGKIELEDLEQISRYFRPRFRARSEKSRTILLTLRLLASSNHKNRGMLREVNKTDYLLSAMIMIITAVYKAEIEQGGKQTERATMHFFGRTIFALIAFIAQFVRTSKNAAILK